VVRLCSKQRVLHRICRGNIVPSSVVRDDTFQVDVLVKEDELEEFGKCGRVQVLVDIFQIQ
jgi:hypothetical protein